MDQSVNLFLALAIYKPILTSSLGRNKHAHRFQLISVGYKMTKYSHEMGLSRYIMLDHLFNM
jgi:hypothetical protein